MAGKEIKIEVVEQMKVIAKQLENLKRQREEGQVLLAGLEQRLTTLEQRLQAVPPLPDSAGAAATHDTTYQQLVQLLPSPEGPQPGAVEVEKPQGVEVVPSPSEVVHLATLLAATETQVRDRVVQLGSVLTARKVDLVAVPCTKPSPNLDTLMCWGLISQPSHMGFCFLHPTRLARQQKWSVRLDAAGQELVKKYHVLLHSKGEEVVFSTSQSWRYTSSMWGYLGQQPWPPPEQLEDELFVKGSVVLCVGI
jgi:hypothetical protein